MVERLLAFLDLTAGEADLEEDDPAGGDINGGGEDDDDGEPSLAVPETKQWGDQAKTWRSACRSRLREEELEFEGESAAECDREEDDPQGESEFPEPNLGPSEDVDQRISYHRDNFRNCGDDEPSLRSTESIDQTHCAEGAPHELEADAFPYDPPRRAGDAPDYIVTFAPTPSRPCATMACPMGPARLASPAVP